MGKIYAVKNPMWYADTFIFSYMEDFRCYVYVKVNNVNKIEEIGINLEKRMHNTRFEDIDKTEASRLQKAIFNRIGKEYWWSLYNHYQRNSYDRRIHRQDKGSSGLPYTYLFRGYEGGCINLISSS